MAATPPGYRPDIRPGNPGDRPHDEPHPPQMPRVQDAITSLDCRAWKGCSNPLFLSGCASLRNPGGRPPSGYGQRHVRLPRLFPYLGHANTPGSESGSVTLKNVCAGDAPSTQLAWI